MPNGKNSVLDGNKLTDEQLGKLYRKLREIEKRINEGVISFSETVDVLQHIIIEGESARHLSVIKGHAEIKEISHLIDCDAAPFVPPGLSVKEHVKGGLWKWKSEIALFTSEKQKEGSHEGYDLKRTINKLLVLNANVLDYLLLHPELIPEDWKEKSVFFWGTIYWTLVNGLCVRYLSWDGTVWLSSAYWLNCYFHVSSPAALAS